MGFQVIEDRSEEWHDFRAKGIGGSDIATIASKPLGYYVHGSEWETYLSKTGQLETFEDSYRARYGRAVEKAVLECWAEDQELEFIDAAFLDDVDKWTDPASRDDGVYYQPPCIVHPDFPYLRGNPDALAIIGGEIYVVEIKTTGIENRWEWEDEAPPRVVVQSMFYAGILADLSVPVKGIIALCEINHDPPIEHRIPYDGKMAAGLFNIAREWWTKYVEGDETPELDGSKAAGMYLDSKPTRKAGETVEDDEGLIEEYYAKKADKEFAEYELNVAKQKIQAKLSGADELTGKVKGKDVKVTYKANKNGRRSMRSQPPRL